MVTEGQDQAPVGGVVQPEEGVGFPPEGGESAPEPARQEDRPAGVAARETAEQAAQLVEGMHPEWSDDERRRFRIAYTGWVGTVLAWVGWEDVQWLMVDGRKLPEPVRFGLGVAALAGGAFIIGPDGLRLPRRRAVESEPVPAEKETRTGGASGARMGVDSDILSTFDRIAAR